MKDYQTYNKKRANRLVRKKVDRTKDSSKKMAITWILLILVALFFVQQRISYIRTEKNVRELLLEERKIRASIQPLKLEERYLSQLAIVEKTATELLSLREPAKWQIFPVDVTKLTGTISQAPSTDP